MAVRRWPVVAQSEIAAEHIRADVRADRLELLVTLPLPICEPAANGNQQASEPTVRVLGQFKPDRDLEALAEIARECPPTWRLEVKGRGWPAVAGWNVTDRFLSEDEFVFAAHRTAQVTISSIEERAGLSFGPLAAHDPLVEPEGVAPQLTDVSQIQFLPAR